MGDTQWQKLDGEPDIVKSKGKTYQDIADAIRGASSTLQDIIDDANTTAQSMDATRKLAGDVKEDIDKALERYQQTGDALVTYSTPLRTAIDDSETAAHKLSELRGDLFAAQQTQRNAKSNVDWMPRGAEDSEVQEADQALSDADGRVESLSGEISTWEGHWESAKDAKDTAARTAKDTIDEVVTGDKVNGLEDSTWDKIKNVVSTLYKVFKVICDIAGILAIFLSWVPILGQILVALAAVGAILSIIESAVKFAKGEIGFGAMLVGVGLGVLSLFGGKIATQLGKLSKMKTVFSSSSRMNQIALAGDDGVKMLDDALVFRNGLPLGGSAASKLKYAFKTPFTQSTSQIAVREAFENGSVTAAQAFKQTVKGSFPNPFSLGAQKGNILGETSTLTSQLADLGVNGVRLEGPWRSAQVLSASSFASSLASNTYGAVNGFSGGDVAGGIKSSIGFGGGFAGGSWGASASSPITMMNDVKTLDSVDFPDFGQQVSYYSSN